MTIDLEKLRRLAQAATSGPWDFSPQHIEEGPSAVRMMEGYLITTTASDEDAAYIAAANPVAVLELLDEIERLRRALKTSIMAMENSFDFVPGTAGTQIEGAILFASSVMERKP